MQCILVEKDQLLDGDIKNIKGLKKIKVCENYTVYDYSGKYKKEDKIQDMKKSFNSFVDKITSSNDEQKEKDN